MIDAKFKQVEQLIKRLTSHQSEDNLLFLGAEENGKSCAYLIIGNHGWDSIFSESIEEAIKEKRNFKVEGSTFEDALNKASQIIQPYVGMQLSDALK